ncbi:hypothetical protein ACSW29_11115 [Rhodococcus sp. GB-02]
MDDLHESVVVGSAAFSRVDSDDSLACWTSIIDVQGVGASRPVSLVIEPATVPESAVRELAATVMARFAESRLEMADPFGIGVLFEGTTPYAVEDLSGAEPA